MKKALVFLIACMSSVFMYAANEHYTVKKDDCQYATKINGLLKIDGQVIGTENNGADYLEIVAFDQYNNCRMAKRPLFNPNVQYGDGQRGAYYYQCQFWGVSGTQYPTIFVYDNESGEILPLEFQNVTLPDGTVWETVSWNAGNSYGNGTTSPAFFNFTTVPSGYPLDITGYGEGTGNYYLIASPIGQVSPGAVTNMIPTSGGYDLFYFDQTKDNEWINYKEGENSTNPGFNLEPGKGYLYAREEGATLTFTGTAYSGNGTFDLVYSTTNSDPIMHGWNLMGNPFATTATVNRDCYVMGEGGSEIILSENRSVEAMQGVFVKALATETEPKVTFEQGNSIGDGAKVVLNVRKDRAATIDRAMVRFNDNSSLPKFMLDNTNTKIYIPQNGDQYAVVSGSNENSLPVNFKAKENGTYTLNIDVENVDMDYLHLIDHKTGDDVDLLVNPNYTFQARSTDYAERFTLVYANTTGLEENFAFFNGSKWVIGNEGKATLQIMDVVGRLLSSEQINGCTEISLGQPAGVYVMRTQTLT